MPDPINAAAPGVVTTDRTETGGPMPTKRCESCGQHVPINEWDYGICWSCRDLAGVPYDE